MPPKHLLEHTLAIPNKGLSMTRNNVLKTPAVDPLNRPIETRSIPLTQRIPNQSLLPKSIPPRILQRAKNPRRPPGRRIDTRLRILFPSRQVEEQVGLDERLRRLVEKDQFLVRMRVDEFVLELLVKLASYFHFRLVLGSEDRGDRDVGDGFVGFGLLGSLFGQSFGCDDVCGGESGGPGGEEDVVFMREKAGGSYRQALTSAFFPELLSMNCLMAGMVPVMVLATASIPASRDPSRPAFWFVMSMALLFGFITAYPMNWWLVSRHMKHGMMTVRSPDESENGEADEGMQGNHPLSGHAGSGPQNIKPPMGGDMKSVSNGVLTGMTILSCMVFGLGLAIAHIFGGL